MTPTIIHHAAKYTDDFYWERVDRQLGWLGETRDESRARQEVLRGAAVNAPRHT